MVVRFLGLGKRPLKAEINRIAVTVNGSMAVRLNRLPTGSRSIFRMMNPHEAIYQALYIQGRGALKRELVSCLRSGRALHVPRARAQAKVWAHVSEGVMIFSRPAEVEDRAVPGH